MADEPKNPPKNYDYRAMRDPGDGVPKTGLGKAASINPPSDVLSSQAAQTMGVSLGDTNRTGQPPPEGVKFSNTASGETPSLPFADQAARREMERRSLEEAERQRKLAELAAAKQRLQGGGAAPVAGAYTGQFQAHVHTPSERESTQSRGRLQPVQTAVPAEKLVPPSPSSADPHSQHNRTPIDIAVGVAGEAIGIPLCHAGWEAIVNAENEFRGIVAILFGLPLVIGSPFFHWWKRWLGESVRGWIQRSSIWWVPLALVAGFFYLTWPEIQRRVLDIPRGKVAYCLGEPCSDYEGRPLGIDWRTSQLIVHGQDSHSVFVFIVPGGNLGESRIQIKDAYIVSDNTGAKISLMASAEHAGYALENEGFWLANGLNPILPTSLFKFGAILNSESATTEDTFLQRWDHFSVVVEPDQGPVLEHHFTREWVLGQLEKAHPSPRPQNTRRQY